MIGKFGTTFGTDHSNPETASYFEVLDAWNRLIFDS